jgi:hypothetical protein
VSRKQVIDSKPVVAFQNILRISNDFELLCPERFAVSDRICGSPLCGAGGAGDSPAESQAIGLRYGRANAT